MDLTLKAQFGFLSCHAPPIVIIKPNAEETVPLDPIDAVIWCSPSLHLYPRRPRHNVYILVAAAAQAYQDGLVLGEGFGQLGGVVDGVGGFEGGDDAFGAAEEVKAF